MEVRVFPCLGRAGVAAKDYPLGTNIIQEHPLLVWKRKDRISLVEAFSKASPEEKQKARIYPLSFIIYLLSTGA